MARTLKNKCQTTIKTMRLPIDLIDKIKNLAKEEDVTFSYACVWLFEQGLNDYSHKDP